DAPRDPWQAASPLSRPTPGGREVPWQVATVSMRFIRPRLRRRTWMQTSMRRGSARPARPARCAGCGAGRLRWAGTQASRASVRFQPAARCDLDAVVDFLHASACVGNVFRAMLHPALVDMTLQRDLAVRHADHDLAGIEIVVVGEAFVDVFRQARVRARVVLRPDTAIAAAIHTVAVLARRRAVAIRRAAILRTRPAITRHLALVEIILAARLQRAAIALAATPLASLLAARLVRARVTRPLAVTLVAAIRVVFAAIRSLCAVTLTATVVIAATPSLAAVFALAAVGGASARLAACLLPICLLPICLFSALAVASGAVAFRSTLVVPTAALLVPTGTLRA